MNYSRYVKTAKKLIQKYGIPVAFEIPGATGGTDPVTGEYTEPESSQYLRPFGVLTKYSNSSIDGTIIQQGDQLLLVEPSITLPETIQNVEVDSEVFQVVNIETIKPGGTAVLYKVQVRR